VSAGLRVAFFGSSLVSAYWNSAARYYRGIVRALHELGHNVTFYEPDVYERQRHRDLPDPAWARVVVYSGTDEREAAWALESARDADVIVKASGVGVFDEMLEAAVLEVRRRATTVVFWDVDVLTTLDRVRADATDPLRHLIPRYDHVFTCGGGAGAVAAYEALGARSCATIDNALDPSTHFRVPPDPSFRGDLGLLADRLPDRERRVDEFFFDVARRSRSRQFVLGGSGWRDKAMPPNVRYAGHVYTSDHNAFNSTPRAVLHVTRDSMSACGSSPATRIFEAAGAGACIISDYREGIELFLEPGREILVAPNGAHVATLLEDLDAARASAIGRAARARVLGQHTYRHRAERAASLLTGRRYRDTA